MQEQSLNYQSEQEEQKIKNNFKSSQLSAQDQAALKIQNLWRCSENRKIYRYYRDIILFKCKGKPSKLLKAINPSEAQLLEAAANVHLRFRLGGNNFPPNIYYKIFLHGACVDLNSFAPRDYSIIKKPTNPHSITTQKITYDKYRQNPNKHIDEGWYLRIDNNGWRPISHKVFNKADQLELFSANKIKYYHFNKDKRREKVDKKQRGNKLRWLQNLYKHAQQDDGDANSQKNSNQNSMQQKALNPLDDDRFFEMDDDEFDKEVNDLIEWSDNLDYEGYVKDWFQLSTSNASENFVPSFMTNTKPLSSVIIDPKDNIVINNQSNKQRNYKPVNYITESLLNEEQD